MIDLHTVIQYLIPGAACVLRDDGDGRGPYIAHWPDPRPQPTPEEIAAAWEALQSAPPPVHHVVTAAEFRDRFTATEQAAFMRLALSDDTAAVILLRLSTASAGIDLASASVRAGLDHLTTRGVLTSERAAEILSGVAP